MDTYLEACEKGDIQLPELLDNLFTEEGALNPGAIEFRVRQPDVDNPSDINSVFQARFGHFDPDDPDLAEEGWFNTNQQFFRQRGEFADATEYLRLDMVAVDKVVYVCVGPHTSTAVIEETYFVEFFNGDEIFDEIRQFRQDAEPRLDLLEEAILLNIDVL